MNSIKENRKWHWVFWITYFLVNHILFSPENESFSSQSLAITLLFTLTNVATAYATLDWWFVKFYKKQQYGYFILAIILTILICGTILFFVLYFSFTYVLNENVNLSAFSYAFLGPAYLSNLSGISALFIPNVVRQRIDMERRNRQLEKEKLESELKFLKSQLHPHFLFNALNNIYFLIKKDPDTAAEALAGFSNLLRFQLYDANNSHVPLKKEIEYLQQFADIAQLRKGENFKVNWDLASDTQNVQIAPLLLMPLIENAFKHSSNKNGKIDIDLKVDDQQQLQFRIANSKEKNKSQGIDGFEEGGIGLPNIQKRLKLIYPNSHKFTITNTVNEYIVDLSVALEALMVKKPEVIKTNTNINSQPTI